MKPRRRLALATLLLAPSWSRAQSPAAPAGGDRAQFALRALELRDEAVRRGDQPYGAVVVKDGVIVGEGVNAIVTTRDAPAHAERVALRAALVRLRTNDLSGCVLFGSSRACAMCETGAARARIARMYYGPDASDAGSPRERSQPV